MWIDKSGQHLLHECNSAVSTLCAWAQKRSQEVHFRDVLHIKFRDFMWCNASMRFFWSFASICRYSGALRSSGANAPSQYITAGDKLPLKFLTLSLLIWPTFWHQYAQAYGSRLMHKIVKLCSNTETYSFCGQHVAHIWWSEFFT